MKKEYNLKSLKRRPGTVKIDLEAAKVPTSIRLDGSVVAALKTESQRLNIPYQTLIGSILFQYVNGELVDKKTIHFSEVEMTKVAADLMRQFGFVGAQMSSYVHKVK